LKTPNEEGLGINCAKYGTMIENSLLFLLLASWIFETLKVILIFFQTPLTEKCIKALVDFTLN